MSEEKVRVSGEAPRAADAPILPTVNPAVEKVEAKKSELLPPWIYVVSVSNFRTTSRQLLTLWTESGFPSRPALFFSTNTSCRL
jgi:hypothetical protein